jgi:hypothetical protein
MFGLGMQEMLVLFIVGSAYAGVGLGVAVLTAVLIRRGGGRVAELEAENRRLRDDLDRRRE